MIILRHHLYTSLNELSDEDMRRKVDEDIKQMKAGKYGLFAEEKSVGETKPTVSPPQQTTSTKQSTGIVQKHPNTNIESTQSTQQSATPTQVQTNPTSTTQKQPISTTPPKQSTASQQFTNTAKQPNTNNTIKKTSVQPKSTQPTTTVNNNTNFFKNAWSTTGGKAAIIGAGALATGAIYGISRARKKKQKEAEEARNRRRAY